MLKSMIGAARHAARWSIGWHQIGFAIGLAIFVGAGAALFHLLQGIDVEKIVAALRATPLQTVLVAGGFVVVAYITLTFYDFFALRTIGRNDVPYRWAAFTGFASYTVGHNLGATVFTGGLIRYRIYSFWNLSVIEVAKVAFITGLTFWLGNAFVLGLGVAYEPEAASAINQMPASINRSIALIGLAVIAGYLIWLRAAARTIGRGLWQITLPNARLTLVQIAIGVVDLCATSLAMYTLLPSSPAVDGVTVLVIFVMATLLGFLSHAPGSLGVLEAAMLVGLPGFEREQLIASILIFRGLYFILPFAIAVVLLGIRELWLALRA